MPSGAVSRFDLYCCMLPFADMRAFQLHLTLLTQRLSLKEVNDQVALRTCRTIILFWDHLCLIIIGYRKLQSMNRAITSSSAIVEVSLLPSFLHSLKGALYTNRGKGSDLQVDSFSFCSLCTSYVFESNDNSKLASKGEHRRSCLP